LIDKSSFWDTPRTNDGPPTVAKSDDGFGTEARVGLVCSGAREEANKVDGWEMLQMALTWVHEEFSADEEALARQLANSEISYRFLWLYFVPGSIIALEDPMSKQQMAARVPLAS